MTGHPERHSFIPGEHPDLAALQAEMAGVVGFAALQERLAAAPIILSLDLPADARMTIDAQPTYDNPSIVSISFLRSPAPYYGRGEAEWFLLREGERPRPVVLLGACTPGGVRSDPGVIKAGVGFNYYEIAVFRSSTDAPAGLLTGSLPSPETLDPQTVDMNKQIGQIVQATGGPVILAHAYCLL